MSRTPKSVKRTSTGATQGQGAAAAEAGADAMAAAIEATQERYITPRTHAGALPYGERTSVRARSARQLGDQARSGQRVKADDPGGTRIDPTESNLADKQEAYDKARRAGRGR